MERKQNAKRFLSIVMAIAVVFTSVFASNVTTAFAKTSSKSVKSVTLKIGSSTVTKKTKQMYVGTTATLKVTVNPSTAKKKVTYKSGKTSVATVSSKGKITAKKAGKAKITVTVKGKDGKSKSAYVNIKVVNRPVSKVTLDESEATVKVGETKTLKATVTPSNATNKKVTWKSSKTSIATVSSNGVVTAVSEGTAVITATAGGKSDICVVTVAPATVSVTGVTLNTDNVPLYVNATYPLTATVAPTNATNKNITWTTSDVSVASVTNEGIVKGIAEGTAVITVTSADGGFTAQATVNVTKDTSDNVANLEITVANSLKDYPNTVYTGTNADIKVHATNAAGDPVGNTSVTLTIQSQYGNSPSVFGITGDNNNWVSAKLTTDANGNADFTIGEKEGNRYSSTDLIYESYKLSATATGSNATADSTVSFACIDIGDVRVLNNDYISYNDLEPGENAVNWDGMASTNSTNGARVEEYVDSQKVSTFNGDGTYKDDHRVYITAAPYIIIPAKKSETQVSKYYEDNFKKESTEYSVYNDETNENTTTWIKGVPAGLQYATLVFSKIVLSKYTVLEINTYDATTGALIKTYTMDETNATNGFGYQIPIQEDTAVDVEVALISEGQVNDDSNDGFVIDHVEGLYKTQLYEESDRIELKDTVKWEESTTYYSEYREMNFNDAKTYIKDEKYLSSKYTYAYRLPSFPNTGNAVIKVTDANGKIVSYFLYPTENEWQNADGTIYPVETTIKDTLTPGGKYLNRNTLSLPNKYTEAVKASEEEVTNVVGTIEQDGNVAIVDSKLAGRTNLVAHIDIPGVTKEQLDDTTGSELYTSVQWAPIPESEIVEAGDDFYSLASQYVTVKAQLYDQNGNKVTTQNKEVTFTLDGEELKNPVNGTVDNNDSVTINKKEVLTNEKGQGTIRFTSASSKGHVYHLSAECKGYTVKLLVGESEVESELANIYWVMPGLSFTDKISKGSVDGDKAIVGTTTTTLNGAQEVKGIDDRKVANHWIFGYQVVGDLDDDNDVTMNEVKEISNISVQMSKSDDTEMTMTTEGQPNGAALVYTEKVGSSKIIGEIGNDSFAEKAKNVEFTIVDEFGELVGKYTNIGEEDPSITAKLQLNVSWKESGKNVDIVYPNGTLLSATEDSVAYIRVLDDYGNPLQGEKVNYSVTGIGAKDPVDAETDSNGLVAVELKAPGTSVLSTDSTTINAIVDGTSINGGTLYYAVTSDAQFGLVGATLDSTNTENPQIKLTFSSAVRREALNTQMFTVSSSTEGVNNYDIDSVKIGNNNNIVILTLKSSSKSIVDDAGVVTVTVKDYVENGITYKLVDSFGRSIVSKHSSAVFAPKTTYKVTAKTSEDNKTITVKVEDSNGTAATGSVIAYAASTSVLGETGVATAKLNKSGVATISVNPGDTETTVYFYYSGASAQVSVVKK